MTDSGAIPPLAPADPPQPAALALEHRDHRPTAASPASHAADVSDAASDLAHGLAAGFFARYAGSTLRTYRLKLDAFARWQGVSLDRLPALVLQRGPAQSHLDAERYRAWLRDECRAAPATINGHLAALRSLVRFLRRAQLCAWALDVPGERVVAYRDTRGPGLPLVRRLLRAAARQPDGRKAARDVARVRLLTDRALRRAEVSGLDLEHVERGPDRLPVAVLVRGKGRGERERLTLPPKTRSALAAWLDVRGAEPGPLFVSLDRGAGRLGRGGRARGPLERLGGEGIARLLDALAKKAGADVRVRPHGLRHTAITAVLDAGVGLREAQRFSRHADPRTLMRYDDNRADIAGDVARSLSELL